MMDLIKKDFYGILLALLLNGLFNIDAAAQTGENKKIDSSQPDRIVLTWAGNPSETQSVTWRTTQYITKPVAQLTTADPSPNLEKGSNTFRATTQRVQEEGKEPVFYHSVTFSDLTPGTLYAYRVGGESGKWSAWNQFRTADPTSDSFSFIYLGDVQNNIRSLGSRTIRESYAQAPRSSFMLFAGDLVNDGHNDTQWEEWFDALGWIFSTMPIVPITGNHEYDLLYTGDTNKILSRFWEPQFELPENGPENLKESAYYLDYNNMRLIVLNSTIALRSKQELDRQTQWLRRVLSMNTQKWTIVSYHHSLFSARDGNHGDYPELRSVWHPIFKKYQVDLVLQGHDHIYGRSHKKHYRYVSSNKTDAEPVYVVSVAGPKMYGIIPAERWMDRAAVNTQLYQIIEVSDDTLSFRAYTVDRQLYDSFDLIKEPAENKRFIEHISSENHPEYLFEDSSYTRN